VNGNRFLLDTNILLYITGKRIDITALPEGAYFTSFITEFEILSYPSLTSQEEKNLKRLLHEIPIVDITSEIKEQTISFRKKYRLKLPDAIIAATALFLRATLVTNDKSFLAVKEIKVKSIEV
jgi:predicted nucleic acid-binding protein